MLFGSKSNGSSSHCAAFDSQSKERSITQLYKDVYWRWRTVSYLYICYPNSGWRFTEVKNVYSSKSSGDNKQIENTVTDQ